MSYDSEVLADSPFGYWKTDETSGTNLADSSGNSRPLTITGSPTLAQTGPSSAADAISWPSSASTEHYAISTATITGSAGEYSLECWFYLPSTPTALTPLVTLTFSAYGNTSARPISLYLDTSGNLVLRWGISTSVGTSLTSASAVSTGAWHHVVATVKNGVGGLIRLDKSTVASGGNTTLSFTTGAKAVVHGGGNMTGASIDLTNGDVVTIARPAIYSTALTTTRIDAHYDALAVNVTTSVPLAATIATGLSPAVATDAALAAPALAVAKATGLDPTVTGTIGVPAAAASATGFDPSVTTDANIDIPLAAATVTGLDPTATGGASGDITVTPDVATATSTGFEPTVTTDATIDMALGAAVACGLGPTVALDAGVAAELAASIAAGFAPTVTTASASVTVTMPLEVVRAAGFDPVWTQILPGGTDTSNANNGRTRSGSSAGTTTSPVLPAPPGLTFGVRVDKAIAYPTPDMVDGRPT